MLNWDGEWVGSLILRLTFLCVPPCPCVNLPNTQVLASNGSGTPLIEDIIGTSNSIADIASQVNLATTSLAEVDHSAQ